MDAGLLDRRDRGLGDRIDRRQAQGDRVPGRAGLEAELDACPQGIAEQSANGIALQKLEIADEQVAVRRKPGIQPLAEEEGVAGVGKIALGPDTESHPIAIAAAFGGRSHGRPDGEEDASGAGADTMGQQVDVAVRGRGKAFQAAVADTPVLQAVGPVFRSGPDSLHPGRPGRSKGRSAARLGRGDAAARGEGDKDDGCNDDDPASN
jgi:hypothetical protein